MSKKLHPHEKAARVIRLMAWLSVLAWTGILLAIAIPQLDSTTPIPKELFILPVLFIGFTSFLFLTAKGIFAKKNWARIAGFLYSAFALLGFPIGTIVGIYVIWQLSKGWPAESATVVS